MGGASQPLKLDSRKPTMPVESFTMKEGRYAMLAQADPARAKHLLKSAQADADARWQLYEQIAGVHRNVTDDAGHDDSGADAAPAVPAPSEEVKQ
jgi:pyruvate-ferredoxin/flavodoxin oxidoreductase